MDERQITDLLKMREECEKAIVAATLKYVEAADTAERCPATADIEPVLQHEDALRRAARRLMRLERGRHPSGRSLTR